MVEKVVVMNCHVQQKVKVGNTVCDEASVVPWEVHSRDNLVSGIDTCLQLQVIVTGLHSPEPAAKALAAGLTS